MCTESVKRRSVTTEQRAYDVFTNIKIRDALFIYEGTIPSLVCIGVEVYRVSPKGGWTSAVCKRTHVILLWTGTFSKKQKRYA